MHIRHSRKIATKFTDPNPSNTVVFGTVVTGPATKNFARLNDPAKELRKKVYIGRALGLTQSIEIRYPASSTGKSADVSIRRANDMWHYNKENT